MAKPKPRSTKKTASGGAERWTMALVALWVATTIAVVVAYELRPAAPMVVTVVASNVGFDVLAGSRQLLLGDADVASFTVAAFDALIPTPRLPGSVRDPIRPQGVGTASLTVTPARLETVTAPGDAHVVVNWSREEPDTLRLSVRGQPAHGTFALGDNASVRCSGCGVSMDSTSVSGFEWSGRAASGGTTLLLRRDLTNPLQLSQDDISVQGALDTSALSGDQRVSTITEGRVQLLNVDRAEPLSAGSRLIVEQIEPRTGRLKGLSVARDGIHVTLEGKVGRLGIIQAGQFDNRLPSWLELGFKNQSWLYFTQGVLLVGGTASKLLAWVRQRRTSGGEA